MTAPFPMLRLNRDGTILNFVSGTGTGNTYPLERDKWAPQVASYRPTFLGNVSPFSDVRERFVINIPGTSAAQCWAAVRELNNALVEIARWDQLENTTPTFIEYVPQGSTFHSTAVPMSALCVTGTADPAQMTLNEKFNSAGMYYELSGIELEITRRGLWTGAVGTSLSTSQTPNFTISATLPFPNHHTLSPYTLAFGGAQSLNGTVLNNGLVFITPRSSNLVVGLPSVAGNATVISDNTSGAYQGQYVRAVLPGPQGNAFINFTGLFSNGMRQIAFGFTARLVNATSDVQVVLNPTQPSRASTIILSPSDVDVSRPKTYLFDLITTSVPSGGQLMVIGQSGSFEIDRIVEMGIYDTQDVIIGLERYEGFANHARPTIADQVFRKSVGAQGSIALDPNVYAGSVGFATGLGFSGNAALYTRGATLFAYPMTPAGTTWSPFVGTATTGLQMQIIQARGFVVPE